MVRLTSLAAFAASIPFVFAVPSFVEFRQEDVARGFCGTETTPDDIAAIQEVIAQGSYESFDFVRARSNAILTGRAPIYPWGNAVIKTWIHVIAASETLTDGWIPDSQIHAQMDVLNHDFGKCDKKTQVETCLIKILAPHNFQFVLEGITRTVNAGWANDVAGAQLASKKALRKGDYATLNIYFLKNLARGALGVRTPDCDVVSIQLIKNSTHIIHEESQLDLMNITYVRIFYHLESFTNSISLMVPLTSSTPCQVEHWLHTISEELLLTKLVT